MAFKTLFNKNSTTKPILYLKCIFLICIQFALIFFFNLLPFYLSAEGTKELMPNSSDFGFIQINDRGRKFATYNAPEENRLYIHICNAGEIMYYGFNEQTDKDVSFRIKDPKGNIVVAEKALPNAGQGFIANYTEAVAGPAQLVGAGGYDAFSYTALLSGDYYIEFTNPGNTQRIFDYFDITVATGTASKLGRVWSYSWDINTNKDKNPFTAKMYILSTDSIVTSIDFNGMQPFGAVIAANATGLSNTGNLIKDRKSKVGNFSVPEYKIFLNDPDPDCYPTGSFGNIVGQPIVTGCDPQNRCINISVNKPGKVEIVLDLNSTLGYQVNTEDLLLVSEVTTGKNCIPWDSKDGQGNIVTATKGIPLEISYLNGVTHLPLYDVEDNPNGYIVELVRPAGSKPNLYWDDSAINKGSATDGKINLTGCSNASGCHKWKDRGDNASAETINTWWYPNIITKNLLFDIPLATVDADNRNSVGLLNDSLVCEEIPSFKLSGYIEGTTLGGSWTGGTGTFTPSRNVENPIYIPSLTERSEGTVKLYLISTTNGICPPAKDSVKILFEKAPLIKIDLEKNLCSTTKTTSITAVLTHASTGIWTGGNGSFTSNTNKETEYSFSPDDITKGSIELIFTSNGSRLCKQADDTLTITLEKPPIVELAKDKIVCFSKNTLEVEAKLTNATTGIWTGGNGTFDISTNPSTTYTIVPADTIAGNIDLIFTSTGVRACPQEDDSIHLIFNIRPSIELGNTITICEGVKTVTISATGDHFSSLIWTGGNGSFLDKDALKTTYTLNANELKATHIDLTLTAKNGECPDSSALVSILISPSPLVNAGTDTLLCKGTDFKRIGTSNSNDSFQWYEIPTQTTVALQNSLVLTNIQTSGEYVLEAKTKNNCSNSDTISIGIYELPKLNPGGPYCFENQLILKANATELPSISALYIWSLGTKIIQSDPILTDLSITDPGEYTLTYKTNTCSKDTIVTVNSRPILTSPDTLTACIGGGIDLFTKSNSASTLTWFDSKMNFIETGITTLVTATETSKLFYVEAKDINGCTNTDSLVVMGTILPKFGIKSAEICKDSVANLKIIPSNIPTNALSELNYQWHYNSKTISTDASIQTQLPGIYTGILTFKNCSASETTNVIVHELPISELPNQYTFCADNAQTVSLDAGKGFQYKWIQSEETTQSITVTEPGNYDVFIYNTFRCKVKASTVVKEECMPTLFLSSAFSPNGDEVNDIFKTFDNHIETYSMTIYNRWGEIVFQSMDKTIFWDGYYRGQLMPIGVYPFILTYEGNSDRFKGPYSIKGSVTLIK